MTNTIFAQIKNTAKKVLLETIEAQEEFSNRAFFISEGEIVESIPVSFRDDEEQKMALEYVGELSSQLRCHEIVYVVDTFYREVKSKDESDYINKNWDTERPTTYPESMRQNGLMFLHFNFKDKGEVLEMLPYDPDTGSFGEEKRSTADALDGAVRASIADGLWKAEEEKAPPERMELANWPELEEEK